MRSWHDVWALNLLFPIAFDFCLCNGKTHMSQLPKKTFAELPDPPNYVLFFQLFFEVEFYTYLCDSFILFSHLVDCKFPKEKYLVFFGPQLYLGVAMCLGLHK